MVVDCAAARYGHFRSRGASFAPSLLTLGREVQVMKRLVIIPLAICIMLAFPFSVYASSMDDVTSNVTLTYSMAFDFPSYPALSGRYIGYFPTSSNLYLICSWIFGGTYVNDDASSVTVKLDLPEESDLYIGTNFFELTSSDLYMYYDSSQSFSTEIFLTMKVPFLIMTRISCKLPLAVQAMVKFTLI